MADVKISALPPASTPLDGTELVPIVQGGITEQVTVANMTAGRTVAAATVNVDANSASAALRVTQTGAGNALLVEDSANPDSTPFVIDANGRVVLGYTSALTLAGATPPFQYHSTVSTQAAIAGWSTTATAAPTLSLYRSASGVVGTQGAVVNGSDLGAINFFGDDNTAFIPSAQILAEVDGTPGTNDMPGRLTFSTTADGASSVTERMRINSSGNVGLGTANNIADGGTAVYRLAIVSPSTTSVTTEQGLVNLVGTASSTLSSGSIRGVFSTLSTAAASFTLNSIQHFRANQGTIGAGSSVTSQYGFFADGSMVGATSNYGFYSSLASGTGRWGFYAAGTANNAYNGNSRFGGVTAPVATVDVTGSVAATTTILSTGATSGIGYATGAGGAVTQGTSRTTGVTLNTVSGAITLFSAAGLATYQSFTVTNSAVAATDTIILNQKSGTDKYILLVTAVAAGSFQITFATTGGTTTEQPVFNFAVIKAVAA